MLLLVATAVLTDLKLTGRIIFSPSHSPLPSSPSLFLCRQTKARFFYSKLSSQADPAGSSMQRFVYYFLKALNARADGSGYQHFACPVQYTREVRGEGRVGMGTGRSKRTGDGRVEACGTVW